jgi:hypothetical protein
VYTLAIVSLILASHPFFHRITWASNLLGKLLGHLGPHKRLVHLDRHLLDRAGPALLVLGVDGDPLLLDEGAHAHDAHIVGVEEVVTDVELGEGEGDDELGVGGREVGRADEGKDEVGPGVGRGCVSLGTMGWLFCGWVWWW